MSTAELTGTKFFMNFPVTDTSHTLAEYRTRFGYQALEKALSMAPTDVTLLIARIDGTSSINRIMRPKSQRPARTSARMP